MAFTIEDASAADIPAILAIYNDVIATSTAVFSEQPATLTDREAWFQTRTGQGFPVLVARAQEEVIGFASFGEFRPWPGYRHTVEHTVHIRADRRGQGAGRALVEELLTRASALGMHAIVAGVDADNAASIALHARLGFTEVGRLPQVATKFGRWLDLVYLQRLLA
jgi:phosphinothricin acetyltransferase